MQRFNCAAGAAVFIGHAREETVDVLPEFTDRRMLEAQQRGRMHDGADLLLPEPVGLIRLLQESLYGFAFAAGEKFTHVKQ